MTPASESQSPNTDPQIGVVVEDFGNTVIDPADLGRDWAPMRRRAIALDDGRLVFAAEGGLKPA